ncbi:MAG: type IV pilus twitching motility protein PilT [Deltaproteobacteria bacterium]|nr:type IV pilus twitching motility protein PilT [Deltaproteobacteria bacterium]
MKVLLAQPVRADQIQAILKDVVPPEVDHGFTSDGDATFTFDAGGPVVVHLRRFQGRLDALVKPQHGTAAATTAVPSPAPAPSVPPPSAGVHMNVAAPLQTPTRVMEPAPLPPAAFPSPSSPQPAPSPAAAMAPPQPVVAAPGGRRQIDPLLYALVQHKASDLHITAHMQPRLRKDGDIGFVPGFEGVLSSDAIRAMLLEIAPLAAREKFEKTNDADYAYELPGLARFRVNAFKDRRGVSGVLRVIPSKILTFEDLKLPNVTKDFCSLHKGLVVVTGPTGSGKSTTLAAMVDWINRSRTDHIITIEDPVEFVHETKSCLVNQREVHVDTQSFAAALRAALREDPDIVLVGEMRDLETVGIAIETAETGHLVFGTLHTTTAVSTIDRIIDQFPTDRQEQVRMMLSESLKGVIAQTLCKKIGGGRVAALEILVCNVAVANLIREGKTFQIPSMMQTQKSLGMQTLNDALFALVKDGVVAPDDAFAKSVDRTSFKMMLDKANIKLAGH